MSAEQINTFSVTCFLSLKGQQFWKLPDSNMFYVSVSYLDYIITCPLCIVRKKKEGVFTRWEIPIHELITVSTIYPHLCNASGITKNEKNAYYWKISCAGTGKV